MRFCNKLCPPLVDTPASRPCAICSRVLFARHVVLQCVPMTHCPANCPSWTPFAVVPNDDTHKPGKVGRPKWQSIRLLCVSISPGCPGFDSNGLLLHHKVAYLRPALCLTLYPCLIQGDAYAALVGYCKGAESGASESQSGSEKRGGADSASTGIARGGATTTRKRGHLQAVLHARGMTGHLHPQGHSEHLQMVSHRQRPVGHPHGKPGFHMGARTHVQ